MKNFQEAIAPYFLDGSVCRNIDGRKVRVKVSTWENQNNKWVNRSNKSKSKTGRGRASTVDGIKIYDSVKALIEDLGAGKHGYQHPDFRYVDKY